MANGVYNRGKYLVLNEAIGAGTDLRVLLVKSSYTFDATHNTVADVIAGSQEISVGGYSRQALASEALTEDDGNNQAYLDATDVTFSALASGQTIGGAVLYKFNAADASADVVAFYDVADTPTNGGDIIIQWAAPASGGVLKLA